MLKFLQSFIDNRWFGVVSQGQLTACPVVHRFSNNYPHGKHIVSFRADR